MCTIGYLKDLNLIFKNRDKSMETEEELVVNSDILACRTVGDSYFSWGVNHYGCAFVSTAVNSPRWMQLLYDGETKAADDFLAQENEGLQSPMQVVSDMLATVRTADEWVKELCEANGAWRGYNIMLADRDKTYHLEVFRDQVEVRVLGERDVITNHFQVIKHGPEERAEYPSTYRRYEYSKERIGGIADIEGVFAMMNPSEQDKSKAIWRDGTFHTVSSAVIDLSDVKVFRAQGAFENYQGVRMRQEDVDVLGSPIDGSRFEMSRYIDLEVYHEVERSHPYYVEMLDDICGKLKSLCKPTKKYRILEFGAGTGIFTEKLLEMPFLEVTVLEKDMNCCKMLDRFVKGKGAYRVIQGDAVEWVDEEPFDFIVSTFAHDHIHYELGIALAKNLRKNLKLGGSYLMGGEILPFFESESERKDALDCYHGFIVAKALREGHYRLAQIEINALESGVGMIGDFKRHEELFEKEMAEGVLELDTKAKMGPLDLDDVGGVYVYHYVRRN